MMMMTDFYFQDTRWKSMTGEKVPHQMWYFLAFDSFQSSPNWRLNAKCMARKDEDDDDESDDVGNHDDDL